MRFLVRLMPSQGPSARFLDSMKVVARSVGVEARNPKLTSYGALELDIFCPARADLDTFLAAAGPLAKAEFVTDLNRAPEHLSDEEILTHARGLFNAERYWECHEVLEGLWRQKQGEEKRLLQGIILVCAALVHHQKGEDVVALSVLGRGMKLLEFARPHYGPFRVSRLRDEARRMLETRSVTGFTI